MTSKNYRLEPHPEFGFLQIKPTPTLEEITKFYADEFYSGDYKRLNDSSLEVQVEDADFYNGRWEDLTHGMTEVLGRDLKGLDVLDVGCGWGQALLHFRKLGMECCGFDPAPEAIAYGKSKGLNLKVAGFDNLDLFQRKFDVVTLLNVLEHLSDPVTVLKELREKVLKPNGIIVIDVPNEFNAFQVTGQKLHHLDEWWIAPPAHLNYFSKDSLCHLLEGLSFKVKLTEASFPLEMFLLFGRKYVGDPVLGKQCHKERVAFEVNLRKNGKTDVLRKFYRSLAEQNLGRQIVVYAKI